MYPCRPVHKPLDVSTHQRNGRGAGYPPVAKRRGEGSQARRICLTPWACDNIVITMKAIHVNIRRVGNSQGVVIPKPILTQLGLSQDAGVDMTIEGDALVLRRPANPVRTGWADAAKKIAEAGDDRLVMGEFGNAGDAELVW